MENLEPKTRFEYFLNKIATNNNESSEQSGGALYINIVSTRDMGATYILDKTYAEISNALSSNKIIIAKDDDGMYYYLDAMGVFDNVYAIRFFNHDEKRTFVSDTETGVLQESHQE